MTVATSPTARSSRLGLRATVEQETVLRRAAEVARKSLTDFILDSACLSAMLCGHAPHGLARAKERAQHIGGEDALNPRGVHIWAVAAPMPRLAPVMRMTLVMGMSFSRNASHYLPSSSA